MPRAQEMAAYVRDGYDAFFKPNLIVAVEKCWYLEFEVTDRTSMWFVCIATLT